MRTLIIKKKDALACILTVWCEIILVTILSLNPFDLES
jgi:hypothetical protein